MSPSFPSPWSAQGYAATDGAWWFLKPLFWLGAFVDFLNQVLGQVINGLILVTPGIPRAIAENYSRSGGYIVVLAVLGIAIVKRSERASRQIVSKARAMWRSAPPDTDGEAAAVIPRWSWPIRRFMRWTFLPNLFGVSYWLVAGGLLLALVNQMSLSLYTRSASWCPETADAAVFYTSERCHPLRKDVFNGQGFELVITVPPAASAQWYDRPTRTSPLGYTYLDSLRQQIAARSASGVARVTATQLLGIPLRQNLTERWFKPIVAIKPSATVIAENAGNAWVRTVPVDMELGSDGAYHGNFVAPVTGRAYLYVNDVTIPALPWKTPTYDENSGWAIVQLGPA